MKSSLLILTILFLTLSLTAQEQVRFEERILAIVGDKIIVSSEAEVALMMDLGGKLPSDSTLLIELLADKVKNLIDEKLILLAAERESIDVDEQRIDEVFDNRWEMLISGYGGENALETALKTEGYTVEGFKRKTRAQIKDYLRKQSYIERYFGRTMVTESEVDSFFSEFKDSLPEAPPEVQLQSISVLLEPDSVTIQDAYNKIVEAKERIDSGEEFESVAAEFSEDESTAPKGGFLGTYSRGDLVGPLDSLAFNMKYGEIGGPVRSPLGYHLLKIGEKKNDQVTLYHILIKTSLSPDQFSRLELLADSIKSEAEKAPESFGSAIASKYADYPGVTFTEESEWIPVNSLQGELLDKVKSADSGDIIGPLEITNELVIYKVVNKQLGRELSLERDRQIIREAARQMKISRSIEEHIQRLSERFYIEIRI